MKKNVNGIDGFIRVILGIAVGFLVYIGLIDDSLLNNLGIAFSVYLVITGIARFCLLYSFLGVSTKKKKDRMY